MPSPDDYLPIRETKTAADPQAVVEAIQECHDADLAVYPIGGGTSLGYGVPPSKEGVALSLAPLDRVLDYPARDMTITVEAGIRMQRLAETLAAENQRLPVDVPQAAQATLGGAVATHANGPRRYGQGSLRDHVIGISAVDGCGRLFHGGGKVVKNVAGYDFCKLLTGSLGTLGVVTELTLRLKPLPDRTAIRFCALKNLDQAEQLLTALVLSPATPVAIELLAGPAWQEDGLSPSELDWGPAELCLAVALEGSEAEVAWMEKQLDQEWHDLEVDTCLTLHGEAARQCLRQWAEFPAAPDAPLVLQASVAPSRTTEFVAAVRDVDPQSSFLAHAGNGIVIARMSQFPVAGLSKTLVGRLQPIAFRAQGNVVILSNPSGDEMTRRSVWGGVNSAYGIMSEVKRQFDPKNVLNPDRFIYD